MIIDRLSHSRVKMKAKITTIIPTFRRPHLVGRAICSVLSQNYEKFEVRVLDNASGDETGEVVKRIASGDPRVTYHCHPFDIGPWRNFKYGLDSVETPFFNLLSDDDALLPGFFTAALDSLERHPQAGMFAGATVRVGPKFISTPVLKWPRDFFQPRQALLEILRRDFPDWNAIMFRRDLLAEAGSIDISFQQAIDLDFVCRCAATRGMIVEPAPYAILTLGHNHLSRSLYSPATHAAFWLRIFDRYETASWIDQEAQQAFDAARTRVGRKVLRNAFDGAATRGTSQALEAAACLKASFAMDSAPLLLRLMTADSALGAALRQGWRIFRKFGSAVLSPIRLRLNRDEWRSAAAVLSLDFTEGIPVTRQSPSSNTSVYSNHPHSLLTTR
jgi:glycosyltransferase involved in cell wall biosynthesis